MSIAGFSLPEWEVVQVEEGDVAYHLTLIHAAPEPFCSHCGAIAFRHGRIQHLYVDTPIQGKRVGLLVHKQRFRCTNCRKTFVEVLPEMDEVRSVTRRLRTYVEQEALRRSFISIADEVGIHEKTVRTIFREYFTYRNQESDSIAPAESYKTMHKFVLKRSKRERADAGSHLCEQPNWDHRLPSEQDIQHAHIQEELSKRYTIACLIAELLTTNKSILSVIVFGSLAQGSVDKSRDIDFLIICRSAIVTMTEREHMLTKVEAAWFFGYQLHDNPVFAHTDIGELATENIRINIHYQTTSWVSSVLKEVFACDATTIKQLLDYHNMLMTFLQSGWLLYDKRNVVRKWRESMMSFSKHLKVNILEYFFPRLRQKHEELEKIVRQRLAPWIFLHSLHEVGDALISTLFALNEVYEPEDRRVAYEMLLTLKRVPKDFFTKFTDVFKGPFDDNGAVYRTQVLQTLVVEVLKIVETELALKDM